MWLTDDGSWAAAEADFQRFYNLNLRVEVDEFHGSCVSRLWNLMFHMPGEGAWGSFMRERTVKTNSRVASVSDLDAVMRGISK